MGSEERGLVSVVGGVERGQEEEGREEVVEREEEEDLVISSASSYSAEGGHGVQAGQGVQAGAVTGEVVCVARSGGVENPAGLELAIQGEGGGGEEAGGGGVAVAVWASEVRVKSEADAWVLRQMVLSVHRRCIKALIRLC